MKKEFIEQIYAGWLAKIIGIRLGAPIEGWSYEKIQNIFGELTDYPVEYHDFAADDDSNGPLFFLRALEDSKKGKNLGAQDVAEALLNYAPYEHGFFWWGGYGISTEHTAYLNLKHGIPAPLSGSIAQNGATAAEQIGGQIFIDTWGLVTPGNPDLAAQLAEKAASVTHDGNGIFGGIFIAVCISYAFVEKDIHKIIEKGLSYLPEDCEYTKVVRAVMEFHEKQSEDWRACYEFVFKNYGYDKYPGVCHIIPNSAVIILALLYGNGDFSDTLNICNMCGWDTDCNVGNIATIMGVRNGLAGIDYDKWRKPINDFLACSSVVGSLNIMDLPYGALYITKLAYELAEEEMPEPWNTLAKERIDSCHFEFPGSTHAMRVRTALDKETILQNTTETAYTGTHALKVIAKPMASGEDVYVYKKTYCTPEDFSDSRYDPSFSPLVYSGQTLHGSAFLPEYSVSAKVSLYVHEAHTDERYHSEKVWLKKGTWAKLEFEIPQEEDMLIDEMGFCFHIIGECEENIEFVGLMDDLYADGTPKYTLNLKKEKEEMWTGLHREISQFTKLKGLMYLEDGELHLSCSDFAEAYTGRYDWKDYQATFTMTPLTGMHHFVNVRVQGAIRSYAAGFLPNGKFAILKNENGYRTLVETTYCWKTGREYEITVRVQGSVVEASVKASETVEKKHMETCKLTYTDMENPYEQGSIGITVLQGSHCKCRKIEIS